MAHLYYGAAEPPFRRTLSHRLHAERWLNLCRNIQLIVRLSHENDLLLNRAKRQQTIGELQKIVGEGYIYVFDG